MATPAPHEPAAPTDLVQLVVFRVGGEEYALDILRIKEVINPLRITPVPKAPRFIEGVIELRGAIVPVVDMRKRFDLKPAPLGRKGKYLIVGIQGRIVGLVVDAVVETLRVGRADLRPPPGLMEGAAAADYFVGVCYLKGRMIFVLNLGTILSSNEQVSLGPLHAAARLEQEGS